MFDSVTFFFNVDEASFQLICGEGFVISPIWELALAHAPTEHFPVGEHRIY